MIITLIETLFKTLFKILILNPIYYLFWLSIHRLFSLFEFICNKCEKVFKRHKYNEKDLNKLINNLNKIPKHIAIAVNEDLIDCPKLIQLIRWCRDFGCNYVSLFSSNDDLFPSCSHLEKQLTQTNGTINGHKVAIDETLRHRTNGFNGKSKSFISLDNFNVCVLRRDDSHQSIVNAVKHLWPKIAPISQDDISSYLRNSFTFPDPELMVSFGGSPALYGYPIWQLRVTEIYFRSTLHDFRFDDFYEVLIKYSKCEQRLGK